MKAFSILLKERKEKMAQAIFSELTTIVENVGIFIGSVFTSVIDLVYDSTLEQLTTFGVLVLVGVGFGLVMWALRFVIGLLKINRS